MRERARRSGLVVACQSPTPNLSARLKLVWSENSEVEDLLQIAILSDIEQVSTEKEVAKRVGWSEEALVR